MIQRLVNRGQWDLSGPHPVSVNTVFLEDSLNLSFAHCHVTTAELNGYDSLYGLQNLKYILFDSLLEMFSDLRHSRSRKDYKLKSYRSALEFCSLVW